MNIENGSVRWIALEGAANPRVVVPGVLLRSDNLQSLTARDVRMLVEEETLEVVLDLRTDLEVQLEGPGPITREPRVRVQHRSLYPRSGRNRISRPAPSTCGHRRSGRLAGYRASSRPTSAT